MKPTVESEFRSYVYIVDRLKEMGWNVKSPALGGQVYTQNECTRQNDKLKEAFGRGRPEYTVDIGDGQFWIIEAKATAGDLPEAIKQAKERAKKINEIRGINCQIITGFAGTPDTTHYIETHCLVRNKWKRLTINKRHSTGFISRDQVKHVINSGKGCLDEYEIDDKLFSRKMDEINKILHNGAIHKRGRAEVLASLLLALANDQEMQLNDDPSTLIRDINSRAESELKKYGKENFYDEIRIHLPTSKDNHIKNKKALARSIEILRDLNIASTINSGRDVLGQCYEQFLKYANDAKEIGIVLTPRHITNFGAEIIDVSRRDIIFDPTCGTGGFLVSALDKVRKEGGDIDKFKRGNLHGVEQDPFIATLAIVNMVFRGDGSSNIIEGDCLRTNISQKFNKVLMNPPFALAEYEWKFIDKALGHMHRSGLLFAVLPTTAMNSSNDGRGEFTWRKNLLKRHTLVAVIKLAEELFSPQASKGTYGVVIKAHCPHKENDRVVWAILNDGVERKKTWRDPPNNMDCITKSLKNYILTREQPEYIPKELDCSPILLEGELDLSPESNIGRKRKVGEFDIKSVRQSIEDAKRLLNSQNPFKTHRNCQKFPIDYFFEYLERGKSGPVKNMRPGKIPIITTSEANNGIQSLVDEGECEKVYEAEKITISGNGSSCCAHYHTYQIAATNDVFVGSLKEDFCDRNFAIFLCAAINNESWRFNYYRKLTKAKIRELEVKIPSIKGKIDKEYINNTIEAEQLT
ncbi:N-6 DNA methylase [Curvivirga sp.]|uniref:N-6 DNA methylase n=1 Tax=Curvivirga sp. TaxID=2856848 RepID=UPI003B5B8E9B